MHIHVLGQTGSGKSASLLFVLALQDILAGKAVIVIDAKGSAENITVMRNLAALAGLTSDLRIFSLTHPEQSDSYNPLWIRPRENSKALGDPLAVAERVFSVFKPEMQKLYSEDLEGHSGAMFNQKATAILPTPALVEDRVQRFIAASEALVDRALKSSARRAS